MMETPSNLRPRPTRTPTPKISERKKCLFSVKRRSPIREDVDLNIMDGLIPLDFETALLVKSCLKTGLRPKVKKLPDNIENILKDNDFVPVSILSNPATPNLRKSPRSGAKKRSVNFNDSIVQRSTKETKYSSEIARDMLLNTPSPTSSKSSCTDELDVLFNDTLNLKTAKNSSLSCNESSDDEEISESPNAYKRALEKSLTPNESPKKKHPKLDKTSNATSPMITTKNSDPNSNTQSPSTNKNFTKSIEEFSISSKSFYSSQNAFTPPKSIIRSFQWPAIERSSAIPKKKYKSKSKNEIRLGSNVSHKIRRPKFKPTSQTIDAILESLSGDKFKTLRANRLYNKKVDEVQKMMRNAKNPIDISRPLNISNINENEAFSDCETDDEFVTATSSSICNEPKPAEVHTEIEENLNKPKKFFKSNGTCNRNVFTITNNLRATFNNGRVSILPCSSTRRKLAGSIKSKPDFTVEQAAVKDIIEWLDTDTVINNSPSPNIEIETEEILDESEFAEFRRRLPYKTSDPELIEQQQLLLDFLISYQICTERNFEIFIVDPENHKEEATKIVDSLITVVPSSIESTTATTTSTSEAVILSEILESSLTDSQEINNFRQRLPFNTSDPVIADQQRTLLDFLIKNQICNEENFQIFIAEPETHRDKASKILQNFMNGSKDGQNEQILQGHTETCMTIDPFSVDAEIPSSNVIETTNMTLESMMLDDDGDQNTQWDALSPALSQQQQDADYIENLENKSNNRDEGNLFPIFYTGKFKPIIKKSTRKKPSNVILAGYGANQYQIDAGQKAFGAKQCPKCGLVYTVHEPEEEKLHAIFHRSINILKFKGWIDEDVVTVVPEWGTGGRIIKVTHTTHPKRLERVIDILNIVDKELGIVSNMVPTPFVAFLAVKRNEIVGFSLVQPLKTANRYILINGVDCCTEETFDARCGISRIWVSPLNRGMKIASNLIETIRRNTIIGVELNINEIAFSSPTEDGKLFAQKISKRKDFLIYQSF